MKNQIAASSLALLAFAAGCGKPGGAPSSQLPPVSTPNPDGIVIKARSVFQVSTGGGGSASILDLLIPSAYASTVTATTTVSSSTTFSLDTSLFAVPANPTPFAVDDFGFLQIGALQDNNLDVCGTNGTTHCGTALIRIYTTGTTAAGLWNSVDQYGAPITAGQTTLATVGLNVAGAAMLQEISIPSSKHVVKLSDFTNPKYDVKVDFTSAGAGTYSSTLVVEYALAP